MKKYLAILLFFSFCLAPSGFCLEWKKIHEAADKIGVLSAEKEAELGVGLIDDKYLLALVYLNFHKDSEAAGVFNKIINANPDVYEARWGLAEVLRRSHKIGESEALLTNLLKEHSDFAPAYITLAYIRYTQLNFDLAVRLGKSVLRMGRSLVDEGNIVRAYLIVGGSKGMLAHYGGPWAKAVHGIAVGGYLKAAEKIRPKDAGVYFGIGSYYLLAPVVAGKDLKKAQEYLKNAVKTDPLFADAYVRLAQVFQVRGDAKGFREYLEKALQIDPQNELALDIKNGVCRFVCARNIDQ